MICNNLFSDVTFQCYDGDVKAHRSILAAKNAYFRAMFTTSMEEAVNGVVDYTEYKNTSREAVEILVHYIYGNGLICNIKDNQVLRKSVLEISHLTQTNSLFQYCWDLYITEINYYNFQEILNLASVYDKEGNVLPFCLGHLRTDIDIHPIWLELSADEVTKVVNYASRFSPIKGVVTFLKQWIVGKDYRTAKQIADLRFDYCNCVRGKFIDNPTHLSVTRQTSTPNQNLLVIHCFCRSSETLYHETLSIKTLTWSSRVSLELPLNLNWIPVGGGPRFFMAYHANNFLCFDCVSKAVYISELVRVSCTSTVNFFFIGYSIYATCNSSIHKFDVITKVWQKITKHVCIPVHAILGLDNSSNLVVISKNVDDYGIVVYIQHLDLWILKDRCCLTLIRTYSSPDLPEHLFAYFLYEHKNQLACYDVQNDIWYYEQLPCYNGKKIELININLQLIVFRDMDVCIEKFHLYSLITKTWLALPLMNPYTNNIKNVELNMSNDNQLL